MHGNPAGVAVWTGARYVSPQDFGEYKGWWVSTGEPIALQEWAAARAIRIGETGVLVRVLEHWCLSSAGLFLY